MSFVDSKCLESLLIEGEEIATESSANMQYNEFIQYNVPSFINKLIAENVNRKDIEKPFAMTAFGDILAYSNDGYIFNISFESHSCKVIGTKKFTSNLKDPEYLKDNFDMDLYEYALNTLGKLKPGECYGYQPLRSLGGGKSNLTKDKLREYLNICIQANGSL